MKIVKEHIIIDDKQSFKLFEPSLKDYFYWHYHPEYELVYVEATHGIRHIGSHISSFMESDLILIGRNIPHLNFDYGIKTDYKQIVVQLREDFLGNSFNDTPEFNSIKALFNQSYLGLSFSGKTKLLVSQKLKKMKNLNYFEQLISLLKIFQILANSTEFIELNDQDTSIKLFLNDKIRMGAIYNYIDKNYNEKPDVNEVAKSVHLSTAAFCRYFKKQTNITFTEFVNQYRITQAKTLLLNDKTISETCYEVGFESLSYFNKLFKKITGENPSAFKKMHLKY